MPSFIGDLPPFGLHLFALRLRLEQCCKVVVTRECLEEHLSKYYDLKASQDNSDSSIRPTPGHITIMFLCGPVLGTPLLVHLSVCSSATLSGPGESRALSSPSTHSLLFRCVRGQEWLEGRYLVSELLPADSEVEDFTLPFTEPPPHESSEASSAWPSTHTQHRRSRLPLATRTQHDESDGDGRPRD